MRRLAFQAWVLECLDTADSIDVLFIDGLFFLFFLFVIPLLTRDWATYKMPVYFRRGLLDVFILCFSWSVRNSSKGKEMDGGG